MPATASLATRIESLGVTRFPRASYRSGGLRSTIALITRGVPPSGTYVTSSACWAKCASRAKRVNRAENWLIGSRRVQPARRGAASGEDRPARYRVRERGEMEGGAGLQGAGDDLPALGVHRLL